MIVSRSKKRFKSARAAWMDIHKKRGITLKTHSLKRMDTRKSYRWEATRK